MKKEYPCHNTDLKNLKGEKWRDIRNYEGSYQVSNLGRIKSLSKYVEVYMPGRQHTISYYTRLLIKKQKVHLRTNTFDNKQYSECTVALFEESKEKTFMVHRLVYDAFVHSLNLENDHLMIMHKDENGLNNQYKNLIAGEKSQVLKRAYNRGRHLSPFAWKSKKERKAITAKAAITKRKPVIQYNSKGKKLADFNSIKEASLRTGIPGPNIIEVLKGRRKLASNTYWEYDSKS